MWRTQRTGRHVGLAQSQVNMSLIADAIHAHETDWQGASTQSSSSLMNFSNLPLDQWVDMPGGHVHVESFANVRARLWCHSGEWKHSLAWDCVKLIDLDKPAGYAHAQSVTMQHTTAPAQASTTIPSLLQNLWTTFVRQN